MGDRVIVVGPSDTLERVATFAEQFNAGPDGWLLEVRVVRVTDRLRRDLGIDWRVEAAGEVGLDAGVGFRTGSAPVMGAKASALVAAVAMATESGSDAELMFSAPLFVLEGETASVVQGERVPVERRTVSDSGTVTTTGFDYIDTGFQLTVGARRVLDGVRLDLNPSVSAITGYVNQIPIVSRSAVESVAVVNSGDWCVLGGLESSEFKWEANGLPGGLGSGLTSRQTRERAASSLLVFVRAVRVHAAGGHNAG